MATAEHLEADVSTVLLEGLPGHCALGRTSGSQNTRTGNAQASWFSRTGSPMHRRMNVPIMTPLPAPESLHMPPQEFSVILNRMSQASRQQARQWRKSFKGCEDRIVF